MPNKIYLETTLNAPIERCFDLARSIDFHQASMSASGEKAVAGKLFGVIEKGEFVEWQATHLFVKQRLSSRITEMERPLFFVDVMLSGAFKSFTHRHGFAVQAGGKVLMTDEFVYETPFGFAGAVANVLFLKWYVTKLLRDRNNVLKRALESDEWKKFLPQ